MLGAGGQEDPTREGPAGEGRSWSQHTGILRVCAMLLLGTRVRAAGPFLMVSHNRK